MSCLNAGRPAFQRGTTDQGVALAPLIRGTNLETDTAHSRQNASEGSITDFSSPLLASEDMVRVYHDVALRDTMVFCKGLLSQAGGKILHP